MAKIALASSKGSSVNVCVLWAQALRRILIILRATAVKSCKSFVDMLAIVNALSKEIESAL